MLCPTAGPVRYLRGASLGLVVGTLTLLGHAAGHGGVPLVAALMVIAIAIAAAAALTRRRLRPAALLSFVAGFQLLGHAVLMRMTIHTVGGPPGTTAHVHGLEPAPSGPGAGLTPQQWAPHARIPADPLGPAAVLPHVDARMLAAHILATAVIVVLVWRADAALFAFAAALRRAIDVVLGGGFWLAPIVAAPGFSRLRGQAPRFALRDLSHPSPQHHRGPPATAAF